MAGRVDRRLAVAVSMAGLMLTTVAARAASSTGAPDTLGGAAGFTTTKLTNPGYSGPDTEPSIKVARDGTVYVGAIRGLPSGIDLWRVDHVGGTPTHLAAPVDSPAPGLTDVALGGGDMDLAINDDGRVAFSSLYLGSVTVGRSTNRGQTFTSQPLGTLIPGDDRQWQTSDGRTVYMSFHDLASGNIDVERSGDGLVYVPAGSVFSPGDAALLDNQLGNIVADREHPGLLYQVYVTSDSPSPTQSASVPGGTPTDNVIGVAISTDGGASWIQHRVFTGPAIANYASVFPAAALDRAGNVFVVAGDGHDVLIFSSTDRGAHWSGPSKVNRQPGTALLPWVAAGGDGGVVVTWLGTPSADSNAKTDEWRVFAAESRDGTRAVPVYRDFTVSDHVVHRGAICTLGVSCRDGRQLGDFFQVALGRDGVANVAWAEDAPAGPATISYARGGLALGPPN